MGTWGFKTFENDEAINWISELMDQIDKDLIICALKETINNDDYLEAPECWEALCAVNIISSVTNSNTLDLPGEVIAWLSEHDIIEFDQADIHMAKEALLKIISESELRELWEESDAFTDWLSYLDKMATFLTK